MECEMGSHSNFAYANFQSQVPVGGMPARAIEKLSLYLSFSQNSGISSGNFGRHLRADTL